LLILHKINTDFLEDKMKSYTIYLIRHGLTDENLQGRYIGHTDVLLSDDGKKQLAKIKEDMIFPPVQAVFTSPLKRCKETAAILYPENKPIEIEGFIEYNFGFFENKTAEQLEKYEEFSRWLAGEKGVAPPYGESNEAFTKRVCETFEKVAEGLMKTGTTSAAIVTHGGVIMTLLDACALPRKQKFEWISDSGHGYTVKITPSLFHSSGVVEVIDAF
jgi:alpha-ribazole phosphatase